jgi:hypothetical protein
MGWGGRCIPIRKALNIDMIEERSSFADQILRLLKNVGSVQVFGAGEKLAQEIDGGWRLPVNSRGRIVLVAAFGPAGITHYGA